MRVAPTRRAATTEALPDNGFPDAAPIEDPDAAPIDGDEPESGPLRRCVVTRERQAKQGMIRFVVGPGGMIVPDLAARLPGRGIWLSARGDVLDIARTRGGFAKAARAPVTVPPDIAAIVRAGLVRRITELLGLTRRAGQAVGGFQKAREWVQAGRAGLVVQALDGSTDERARLVGASRVPVVAPLPAEGLGAAFGRDHLVHVAILPGRLAEAIRDEAGRLAGVVGQNGAGQAGIERIGV